MRKLLFSLLGLLLILTLAGADYWFSLRGTSNDRQLSSSQPTSTPPTSIPSTSNLSSLPLESVASTTEQEKNWLQTLLEAYPQKYLYALQERYRTQQLFESFDLRPLTGLKIYRNVLPQGLVVYELQVPAGQGQSSWLEVKLALSSQLKEGETLNESVGYGENSLFYNSPQSPETGFLLIQLGNTLFGFQYAKQDPQAFLLVQQMIGDLTLLSFI